MRGTPHRKRFQRLRAGIIPAYAGNTGYLPVGVAGFGDHPRVCGEHRAGLETPQIQTGSSPRMRGTPLQNRQRATRLGIIPAYAGNTPPAPPMALPSGDHPRVCGEHLMSMTMDSSGRGSSPRMRGTLASGDARHRIGGIIPAYAGNTPMTVHCSPVGRDHPRVCGEHRCHMEDSKVSLGSSPRMRGTRDATLGGPHRPGIIPAYAGNTARLTVRTRLDGDHPRVCGEHFRARARGWHLKGSSPRMRGTPADPVAGGRGPGIIPAYAGNTK
ncbi:hypothetical protein F7D09_1514 [Bifidobacterium leontopitheci]|uniref:Uncharacterized protein n=1 Tax=Bifidobacterium leontopitheci TaxID=2650774 RepID=A0A6I1GEA4_9BIFI|nr:hypothetical protein F7D09_1514 [Bifidobacterium leontopitheci]